MFSTTFITLTALLAAAIQGASANYSNSCTGAYIENNNFLRASCRNAAGGTTSSALNLNSCIGISGNNLVCRPNGNYAAQGCSGCLIRTGSYMICHCPGGDKIADLNACVNNNNGLLVCA